jgi:hypothetical protein
MRGAAAGGGRRLRPRVSARHRGPPRQHGPPRHRRSAAGATPAAVGGHARNICPRCKAPFPFPTVARRVERFRDVATGRIPGKVERLRARGIGIRIEGLPIPVGFRQRRAQRSSQCAECGTEVLLGRSRRGPV